MSLWLCVCVFFSFLANFPLLPIGPHHPTLHLNFSNCYRKRNCFLYFVVMLSRGLKTSLTSSASSMLGEKTDEGWPKFGMPNFSKAWWREVFWVLFYFIFFFPILGFRRLLLLAICLSFVAHLLFSLVALSLPLSAAGCFLLEYSRAPHFISVVVTHASLKMHLPALAGV